MKSSVKYSFWKSHHHLNIESIYAMEKQLWMLEMTASMNGLRKCQGQPNKYDVKNLTNVYSSTWLNQLQCNWLQIEWLEHRLWTHQFEMWLERFWWNVSPAESSTFMVCSNLLCLFLLHHLVHHFMWVLQSKRSCVRIFRRCGHVRSKLVFN